MPTNVRYRARELHHIMEDAAPLAVVTTAAHVALCPVQAACWDIETLDAERRDAPVLRVVAALFCPLLIPQVV